MLSNFTGQQYFFGFLISPFSSNFGHICFKNYTSSPKYHFYKSCVHMEVDLVPLAGEIYRKLGECPLISSLPGKALRTHVDIARLAERFNKHSQSRAW